jgi:hypothetical protein
MKHLKDKNSKNKSKRSLSMILWGSVITAIGVVFFILSPINFDVLPSLADSLPTSTTNKPTSDIQAGMTHPNQLQQSRPVPDQLSTNQFLDQTTPPTQTEPFTQTESPIQTELGDTLWQPATDISESEKRAIGGDVHDNIENRVYITLNRQAIANLKVNDIIELPIPQQERTHIGLITEVIKHSEHNTSWAGLLEGYGTDYSIVISQSEFGTMATLDTPDGQYILEANGENARLTPTHEITKHIDYSQSDVIEVDLNRGEGNASINSSSEPITE